MTSTYTMIRRISVKKVKMPCMVCDELTMKTYKGIHCCNACQTSFRRSIKPNVERTECICNSRKHTTRPCCFCIFQKCLKLGMKSDSISAIEDIVRLDDEKWEILLNHNVQEGAPSTSKPSLIEGAPGTYAEWKAMDRLTSVNFLKKIPIFSKLARLNQSKFLKNAWPKYSILSISLHCYQKGLLELKYPNGTDIFPKMAGGSEELPIYDKARIPLVKKLNEVKPSKSEAALLIGTVICSPANSTDMTATGQVQLLKAYKEYHNYLYNECLRETASPVAALNRYLKLQGILVQVENTHQIIESIECCCDLQQYLIEKKVENLQLN